MRFVVCPAYFHPSLLFIIITIYLKPY